MLSYTKRFKSPDPYQGFAPEPLQSPEGTPYLTPPCNPEYAPGDSDAGMYSGVAIPSRVCWPVVRGAVRRWNDSVFVAVHRHAAADAVSSYPSLYAAPSCYPAR